MSRFIVEFVFIAELWTLKDSRYRARKSVVDLAIARSIIKYKQSFVIGRIKNVWKF